eukprot:3041525-Rhodomonas_salina.3
MLTAACRCTVCPCRGDDDIDTVNNGEWAWPIDTRKLHDPKLKKFKATGCPKCKYTATVKPVTERFLATVRAKHNHEKVVVKYKPEYITKYKTLYKENTVYVPVYDDPFWNPQDDGRLAGEGPPPFMLALPPFMLALPSFMLALPPFMRALPPFTGAAVRLRWRRR